MNINSSIPKELDSEDIDRDGQIEEQTYADAKVSLTECNQVLEDEVNPIESLNTEIFIGKRRRISQSQPTLLQESLTFSTSRRSSKILPVDTSKQGVWKSSVDVKNKGGKSLLALREAEEESTSRIQFVDVSKPQKFIVLKTTEEPITRIPENVKAYIKNSRHNLHESKQNIKKCTNLKDSNLLESPEEIKEPKKPICSGLLSQKVENYKATIKLKIRNYVLYLMTTPKAKEWAIWDICLRLVDIYYFLIIPTLFAFCCEFQENYLLHFMLFDVLYILRVFFNFIRPVYNEYGELISDYKGIRENYFRQPTGKIELFGAIPFDWVILFISFAQNTYYNDFTCKQPWYYYADGTFSKTLLEDKKMTFFERYDYKISEIPSRLLIYSLLRVNKLFSTISTLRWIYSLKLSRILNGPSLKILKNLLTWQMISHIDACIFWLLETYIDSHTRYVDKWEISIDHEGHPRPFAHRLFANFHTAQKSLFFLQREVIEFPEVIFQCFEALLSAVIFGSTLGNLNTIMRLFNNEAAFYKSLKERNFRITYLSNYMIEHRFPVQLQKKILEQEEFEWIHKRGMDTNSLFNELPKSIRLEVSVHLYFELISKVPIFANVEEIFKVALCERIASISVRKGFYICKTGDVGNEMYFLKSGAVDILTKDESAVIATLRMGSFFGEIALLEDCRRTATIKTSEDSELCVLRKSDFHEILADYPDVIKVFRNIIEEKKAKDQSRKKEEEVKKQQEDAEKRLREEVEKKKELERAEQMEVMDKQLKDLRSENYSVVNKNMELPTTIRTIPRLSISNGSQSFLTLQKFGDKLRRNTISSDINFKSFQSRKSNSESENESQGSSTSNQK